LPAVSEVGQGTHCCLRRQVHHFCHFFSSVASQAECRAF
jgi:hypothetical protein